MISKLQKEITEHRDCLGRLLKIGDCIAVAHRNELMIATVKKLNNKMIKVAKVGEKTSKWSNGGYNKYSKECALLDGSEVSMYLLKNSG